MSRNYWMLITMKAREMWAARCRELACAIDFRL